MDMFGKTATHQRKVFDCVRLWEYVTESGISSFLFQVRFCVWGCSETYQ